ncbi:kinase-like domain-containing protein [Umbelopsis sp. PMI_123]|nr:kinase-like domain-containing protein [Umbelopsis sp. PMI_123]
MNDAEDESNPSRSQKSRKDKYKSIKRSPIRRASTPSPTELAIVPSHSQWPTYKRIALPLPYLPSDYEPSDDRSQIPTNMHQQLSAGGIPDGQKHLELVPYRDWTVISQNELRGNLVLYNPDTRMVTVQTHSSPMQNLSPMNPMEIVQRIVECPYCHRAFDSSIETANNQPDFMDRNYFRLLSPIPTQTTETNESRDPNSSEPNSNHINERSANNLKANAFNQGYYKKFFHEERKLGRGLRGSVYLCEHELDGVNLGHYAVKKVAVGDNHPWLVRMLREVHLMEQLRHPNIVSYKHSWLEYHQFSDFGPEVPCLFILMECANGGNLEEYIEPEPQSPAENQPPDTLSSKEAAKMSKRERIKAKFLEQQRYEELVKQQEQTNPGKRLLSLYEIWSFFFDMLEGLAHLHRHNIVHRDFKPPNLLIKPRILISDFGECEVLDELPDRDRTGATGTLEFMAPELLRLDDHGKYLQEFSPKADMWSLGMVLFYLCYSRLPYHYVNDIDRLKDEILCFDKVSFPSSRNQLNDVNTPSSQDHIPAELKHIIRALLSLNPEARPSCDEILEKIGHLKPKAPNMQNSTPDIERIPSDMGYAGKVVADSDVDEVEEDAIMGEWLDDDQSDISGARKRRRGDAHQQSQLSIRILALVPDSHREMAEFWMRTATEVDWIKLLKAVSAILKVATSTYPCYPYMMSPSSLYPMVAVALLDIYT